MAEVKLTILGEDKGASQVIDNLQKKMSSAGASVKRDLAAATAETGALTSGLNTVGNAATALGVTLTAAGMLAYASSVRQARIEMDGITNSLSAAVGSQSLAAAEFDYVSSRADHLGLSIRTMAKDYSQMAAAAKGTTLEGEGARKVFEGITTASTALHLSQERTHLIMNAVNQMMSKGTVTAEELKGQLGESLPGAYQMAAKAMGLTTAELNKQIEQGKIMASDLLPKLAEEMEKRFGKQIPDAIKSTQAEMNRLDNTLFKLKLTMADSGLFASLAKGATETVEAGQQTITWMGQAKAYWSGMAEKASAWNDAGGLIGIMLGGKNAKDELKQRFSAIDAMTEYSWNKWNERGGITQPQIDAKAIGAKKQQGIDAQAAKEREAAAKGREEAAKTEALREATIGKELASFKAFQEQKTALAKNQSEVEITVLKARYDQGLVSTHEYYSREKQIALDAAQIKTDNAIAYLRKEEEYLNKIKEKKGVKSPEYQQELSNNQKAIEALQTAQLDYSKTLAEYNSKEVAALKERQTFYNTLRATMLDAKEEYVAAEEIRQSSTKTSTEYLRLQAEAFSGVKEAIIALSDKNAELTESMITAQNKQSSSLRTYAEEIASVRDNIDKLNGKTQEMVDADKNLRTGLSSTAELQGKLNLAIAQGRTAAIESLQAQIAYHEMNNEKLRASRSLLQEVEVLQGKVVGYNGNTAIYANTGGSFNNGVSVPGYQSASSIANASTADSYWAAQSWSVNYKGERATGGEVQPYATYRVNEEGTEFLTMGSKGGYITPANKSVQNSGVQVSGGITFNLPNVTNQTSARELARQIMPELRILNSRFHNGAFG